MGQHIASVIRDTLKAIQSFKAPVHAKASDGIWPRNITDNILAAQNSR